MHFGSLMHDLVLLSKRAHLKAGIWSKLCFALIGLIQSIIAANAGALDKCRGFI